MLLFVLLIGFYITVPKKEYSMTNLHHSIGIDVSKMQLDIFDERNQRSMSFPNTSQGISLFVKYLENKIHLPIWRIVLEPSGGYENDILTELVLTQYPVTLVHAKRIRDFAKATGCLEKSDKLDAKILARYGSLFSPNIVASSSLEHKELKALVLRRRSLVDMITAETNMLDKNRPESVVKTILELLNKLKSLVKEVEEKIKEILKSKALLVQYTLLKNVSGVGPATASTLLALLPELGHLSGSKIAKLVGLAPIVKESGSYKGKRRIQGGRAAVRKVLYMATLVAIKHNLIIRKFYERLSGKGKKPKVAIVACMRKMLVILNGKMSNLLACEKVF
jgi:transposase